MFTVTLCSKNHEVRGSNVYEIKTKRHGTRHICRCCHLERQRAYDRRRRAERANSIPA